MSRTGADTSTDTTRANENRHALPEEADDRDTTRIMGLEFGLKGIYMARRFGVGNIGHVGGLRDISLDFESRCRA
jgi:hypothetical protein